MRLPTPAGWATKRAREREAVFEKLKSLLDVAGAQTPWVDLKLALKPLSLRMLKALEYRVRQARAEAFAEGEVQGTEDTVAAALI